MIGQLPTALVGGVAFVVGGLASYLSIRMRISWAPLLSRLAVVVAMILNGLYLVPAFRRSGLVEALQRDFDNAILLATLVGLMGIGTQLSARLRGIDGFLFIIAGAAQLFALSVIGQVEAGGTRRAWFVSHSLTFAISGTLFIAGGVAGVAYLLVNRMLRRKRAVSMVGKVASLEALERFGRWMPTLGFPLFTYGILTGLCGVWHRPDIGATRWYTEPIVLFSVVTWIVFGYLTYGAMYLPQLRGRRAAVLSTYGLGLIVTVFLFREFLSPMHQ